MKTLFYILLIVIFSPAQKSYSQLYQGPAAGSITGGVIVNTDNFTDLFQSEPLPGYLIKDNTNTYIPEFLQDYSNSIKPTAPEGTNFVRDLSAGNNGFDSPSLLIKNFTGVPRTAFIPPDASMASGPTHIIGGVNSTFRIWDKNGNVIKTINAASWLSSLGLSVGANVSDPKIVYDHFSKRWIMAWITGPIGPFSYDVFSVSDDSIPLGNWYNFAMRSDLNGTTPSNIWRDYEGIGYDENAVYITGNGFTFSNSFAYSKMRIVNKSQLYSNTAGAVSWFDIWDIRDAGSGGLNFGIRPSITYGSPGEYYFLCNSNSGTYLSLYKMVNPLTSPSMTGVTIPVVSYNSPPNSGQLGSPNTITAGGTSGFRSEPVFRGGFLYGVHAVRYNGSYSAFKYYKLNVTSNTADEDVTFGQDGFYYSYPIVSVDKNQNVIVSYSRSALTEYIGAYYTSRFSTDPPNTFSPSSPLQTGRGTYINTGTSDRWGDYMGSWLDPATDEDFWIMTEYADIGNNWGTWVGKVRVSPYSSAKIFTNKDSLGFGNVEVNTNSDTLSLKIENYGNTTLAISQIQSLNSEFRILNTPGLPVNLSFSDSINLKLLFSPISTGFKLDSIKITSNDATSPNKYIIVRARGYIINPVQTSTIYGVSGTVSNGILLTINPSTGGGNPVGISGFAQLNGLSIRPSNNQLFATITGSPVTQLVRVNSSAGDAYNYSTLPFNNVRSLAFDLDDILYCSSTDGKLYKYNLATRDTNYVGNTSISNLYGLSINPVNRTLWGISAAGGVYKINKQTAASVSVGSTGLSPNTDIAFSKLGVLYGLSGIGVALNRLLLIDTSTGVGTVVGTNTGIAGINGIAISPEIVGIQNISTGIPEKFSLHQNYPNPFNPSTTIKFDLPVNGKVKLTVYNILGKELSALVNENLNAGSYEYKWEGISLSSGIYFYRLESDGNVIDTKRMILLK